MFIFIEKNYEILFLFRCFAVLFEQKNESITFY
jgi:hypothetical protein